MVAEMPAQLPFQVILIRRFHQSMSKMPRTAMAAPMISKACGPSFGCGYTPAATALSQSLIFWFDLS
jgi:hypothetical protein